ncbi:TetR/AcrR family transcriptional regulator [Actinocorallia sp. B10E7]|uniref:TetR/AcrR family transcriptional regulator n=1 Tax=Actinocorallia sp. B10E7 TaxID=3153558 RepID=UPI00325F12C0
MSKSRSLTPERLVDAALAVLDESGPEAFSMRAVADHLGMGVMSLYRYVEDRAELEIMIVERVLGSVSLDLPPAPWRNRVELLVDRVRVAVAAHPSTMPMAVARRRHVPSMRRWAEAVLAVLAEAGLRGERRAVALRALISYVIGSMELEHRDSLPGVEARPAPEISRADYPHLAASTRATQRLSRAEEFRGGLALVLDGIAGSIR